MQVVSTVVCSRLDKREIYGIVRMASCGSRASLVDFLRLLVFGFVSVLCVMLRSWGLLFGILAFL